MSHEPMHTPPNIAGALLDSVIIVTALGATALHIIAPVVFVAVFSAIAGARISHLRPPKGKGPKPPILPGSATLLLFAGFAAGAAHVFGSHAESSHHHT